LGRLQAVYCKYRVQYNALINCLWLYRHAGSAYWKKFWNWNAVCTLCSLGFGDWNARKLCALKYYKQKSGWLFIIFITIIIWHRERSEPHWKFWWILLEFYFSLNISSDFIDFPLLFTLIPFFSSHSGLRVVQMLWYMTFDRQIYQGACAKTAFISV